MLRPRVRARHACVCAAQSYETTRCRQRDTGTGTHTHARTWTYTHAGSMEGSARRATALARRAGQQLRQSRRAPPGHAALPHVQRVHHHFFRRRRHCRNRRHCRRPLLPRRRLLLSALLLGQLATGHCLQYSGRLHRRHQPASRPGKLSEKSVDLAVVFPTLPAADNLLRALAVHAMVPRSLGPP